MQEGLIDVWQTLERGITPKAELIERRMIDWVRLLGTQVGRGRGKDGEAVDYKTLLPLDQFAGFDEAGEPMTLEETLVVGVDALLRPLNIGPDFDY